MRRLIPIVFAYAILPKIRRVHTANLIEEMANNLMQVISACYTASEAYNPELGERFKNA